MHRLAKLGKLFLTVSIGCSAFSHIITDQVATALESETTPRIAEATPLFSAPAKVTRYAKRLLAKYDADQSGHLSKQQWSRMRGNPEQIDRNQDGTVTLDELLLRIIEYGNTMRLGTPTTNQTRPRDADPSSVESAPGTGDPSKAGTTFHVPGQFKPAGLPGWFRQQDRNGDGQLSLAEYAPTSSQEAVAAFERLDSNRDGLLIPQECVHPEKSEPAQPAKGGGDK